MLTVILSLMFVRNTALAAPVVTPVPVAKSSGAAVTCARKDLRRRDCRLTRGAYTLRLLEKTVVWNDGKAHAVDPLPLVGAGVEWERVRFEMLGGRPILQLWFWDEGSKETAEVQSLHWYVSEFVGEKLNVLAEGVVRKRRQLTSIAEAAPAAAGAKTSKPIAKGPKFIMDKSEERHGVRAVKGDVLEWRLGGETRRLTRGAEHANVRSSASAPAHGGSEHGSSTTNSHGMSTTHDH